MRSLICASMLLLLSGFLLQPPVHAEDKIRIGFPGVAANFLSVPLGQKKGFFQEEGLQVEYIRMDAGLPSLVTAAIRGIPVKVVACYVPRSPTALIARPEFKSVQELKGQTIGLQILGGSLMGTARLIFNHFGLDPDKEIKFLATGVTERRFAFMNQGLTAATLSGPPSDFLGKKMGFVVLARANELFSYPVGGLVASTKKIRERPDEIKRVIKAAIKANRYILQNRDGTISIMAEWLKVDKEIAVATYESSLKVFNEDGGLPENGLRLLIDEAKKQAKVEREISPGEVADLSILRETQKEL